MQQLGTIDAAFVYLESKAMPLHMGGMLIYDPSTAPGGQVTFDQILANFAARAGSARALHRRLARVALDLDHPWWVEDGPVDLGYHISRLALPKPADWRELCAQVARFLERPLDMTRPLWEMLIIEGLDGIEAYPPGSFALITKMHHSAMDGISGMEFMGAIHDQEPVPGRAEPRASYQESESPSTAGLLVRALPGVVLHPWRILNVAAGLGPGLARRVLRIGPDVESEPSQKVPKTRFNGPLGPHRTVGGVRLELSEIKKIKNALPGTTVNDVVMALIGGAIRHYLDDVNELPAESLVAIMPISLHSEENSDGAANQLTVTTLSMGTNIADPLERTRVIHEAATQKKSIREGEGAKRLVEIADAIPAGLMGLGGKLMAQVELSDKMSLANLAVTNVPGPSQPMYLSGAKAVDVYGLAVVASGLGFMNMVSSYCGSLTVGFQSGSTFIPDPERYEECLHRSLAELADAAAHFATPSGSHGKPAGRVGRQSRVNK